MEDTTPFDNQTFEEIVDDPESSDTEEEKEESPTSEEEQAVNEQPEEEEEKNTDEEQPSSEDEQDEQPEEEEQSDEETEEEEKVSVIEALKSQTGIETDEEYDDSLEGAAKYINDAVEEQTQEAINETLQSLPDDVQAYMQFRGNGGDPEEFMQAFNSNWEETELKEDDKDQHETIVRNRLRQEDWDEEEIDEAIDDYKQSGVLYNEAKRSLKKLRRMEENQKENLIEEQKQKRQNREEEIEEAWNDIENTLDETSELSGLPVPESKKSEFFNWMREPVDEHNGQPVSKRDKVVQNADVDTLLTLDYVLFLMDDEDLSFSDVISQKAKSKNAEDLESLLEGSSGEDEPTDKSGGPSGPESNDDVDADQIPSASELMS